MAMRLARGAAAESLARSEAAFADGAADAGAGGGAAGDLDRSGDDRPADDPRAAPGLGSASGATRYGFGGGVGVGVGTSAGAAGGPGGGGGGSAGGRNPDWAFALFERTVRLTIALERSLRAERARAGAATAGAEGGGHAPLAFDAPMAREQLAKTRARLMQMVIRRRQIITVVQEALAAEGRDDETVDEIGRALETQLLDHECSDVADLPIGRMAARILRQMGVTPDWSHWKDADWAREEAETMAQGSPYGDPAAPPISWRGGQPVWAPGEGPVGTGGSP